MGRLMGRLDALDIVAAEVGDPSGEVLSQDEEEMWYSVPIGVAEAIEVDVDPTISDKPFYVCVRRWDRTHALAEEVEVGEYANAAQAARAVKEVLADLAEREAKLVALLAGEPTEEERRNA
jgi:hypothetical protein